MREIKLPAGETRDLAFFINMTGKVSIQIRTRDGTNILPEAWWIMWGFGTIKSLGEKREAFDTDIPVKWWKGIMSAKLRARAGGCDTVVYVSEDASLDSSVTFKW